MASIFKDKKGYWNGIVYIPKLPGEKGRPRETFRGDPNKSDSENKKMLKALCNELEYKISNNLYLKETNETIEQYLLKWHETYAANLAETTQQLYKLYIEKHIAPEIGDIKMKEIKPIQLQQFYNEKIKSGLSGNSTGKLHTFLNRAFSDAIKNRVIQYNPCDGVEKPRSRKNPIGMCEEDNFFALLEITKGTFDEIAILLAGVCGLRRGEIFGLRRKDVDSDKNTITIEETMTRFSGEWLIKPPKSESGLRKIRVPKFVIDAIDAYIKSLKSVPYRIMDGHKPDYFSKHFSKLLSNNKLPHIRFHDLRHFNATIMLKYGVSDKVASERLGHSRVQVTREVYQHVLSDMDNQASNVIEGIFTKKEDKKTGES